MSESYSENLKYHFDEFILDVGRGVLYRGTDEVRIRPRSFDVLCYFLEHPGKLVSRDELIQEVWNGTVVTDDAVTQCLIDIRKAIGDDSQTMIRTVPRRGYLFERPVERAHPSLQGAKHGKGHLTTLVLAVSVLLLTGVLAVGILRSGNPIEDDRATVSSTPSIAVLPFESVGPDSRWSYFADGVSQEIINSLASQSSMTVIARTSSFSLRGQDVATIASQLNVSHVLEGSVRDAGDELRIDVQLVDARSGEYLWTRQFDRVLSASGVFEIQSEIATAVAESLRLELTLQERDRLRRIPTDNMAALDTYFEAREAIETRNPTELDRAAELLRSTIELDPGFALAYVSLADTLRLQTNYGGLPESVAWRQGMEAVKAALEIDDQLGEAYASLGNLLAIGGEFEAAEAAFRRGIDLSPSYAPLYQWYGQYLWLFVARPEEAASYSRIAVALDPRSPIVNRDYAYALIAARRYDEAEAQFDRVIDIDPGFASIYHDKGAFLHKVHGRIADAVPLIETTWSLSPESYHGPESLGKALLDLGEFEKAAAMFDEAHRIAPENAWISGAKVELYSVTGDTDTALENARLTLETYPWHVGALRFMREYELRTRGVDAAIDHYRHSYSVLLGEEISVVHASNYAAAIDVSYLLMLQGRSRRAEQLIEEVRPFLDTQPRPNWFGTPLADVKIEAILGNEERALSLLRAAVDQGWRRGWRYELEQDSVLSGLRESDEFREIIATIEDDIERQRRQLYDSE